MSASPTRCLHNTQLRAPGHTKLDVSEIAVVHSTAPRADAAASFAGDYLSTCSSAAPASTAPATACYGLFIVQGKSAPNPVATKPGISLAPAGATPAPVPAFFNASGAIYLIE